MKELKKNDNHLKKLLNHCLNITLKNHKTFLKIFYMIPNKYHIEKNLQYNLDLMKHNEILVLIFLKRKF